MTLPTEQVNFKVYKRKLLLLDAMLFVGDTMLFFCDWETGTEGMIAKSVQAQKNWRSDGKCDGF
jgi:hypothetical protein